MRYTTSLRAAVFTLCLLVCTVPAGAADNPVKRGLPMQPPRALVQKLFPQDPLYLSLSGGWGYEQTDPVVITTPRELEGEYFDTEPLEFALVDFRNYEEFAGARPEKDKMFSLGFESSGRRLVRENGRVYSCITGNARAVPLAALAALGADVEAVNPKDMQARKALDARVSKLPRTYWFDVTEPFAHNAELEQRGVKPPKDTRR